MSERSRMSRPNMHRLFGLWGDWHVKNTITEAGWSGVNLLHRICTEGHLASGGIPGHAILCREMAPDVQKVQRGVLKLSKHLRKAVVMRYCAPLKNGREWTNREMADALGLNPDAFRTRVDRARREVRRSEFEGLEM